MKWVHREICNSRTYQLSWQPNDTNAKDERNFARSVPRRLPAEVAVDAVQMALASDVKAATYLADVKGRAIAVPGASARANAGANARDTGFALQVFGRSIRESNCDCDRSMEASLLQTVYLQNDSSVLQAIEQDRGSWIAEITKPAARSSSRGSSGRDEVERLKDRIEQVRKSGNEQQAKRLEQRVAEMEKALGVKKEETAGTITLDESGVVRQAYLRTLSRLPTQDEMSRCQAYLAQADSPIAGAKGLLWTLINTKEFIVNH
jgi:hypothetical protein